MKNLALALVAVSAAVSAQAATPNTLLHKTCQMYWVKDGRTPKATAFANAAISILATKGYTVVKQIEEDDFTEADMNGELSRSDVLYVNTRAWKIDDDKCYASYELEKHWVDAFGGTDKQSLYAGKIETQKLGGAFDDASECTQDLNDMLVRMPFCRPLR